ncbi:MAG: hypothetical protein ACKPKO_44835, partial [Candidatus Fonsibacter sp.]
FSKTVPNKLQPPKILKKNNGSQSCPFRKIPRPAANTLCLCTTTENNKFRKQRGRFPYNGDDGMKVMTVMMAGGDAMADGMNRMAPESCPLRRVALPR